MQPAYDLWKEVDMQNGDDHGAEHEPSETEEGWDHENEAFDGTLEREVRAWSGGRGFDDAGYGYGAYGASDDS